jgi:hypothetical protein
VTPRPTPPRWAVRWLERRLAADERDEILGDLDEQFRTRVDRIGEAPASRWYVRQAIALSGASSFTNGIRFP